MFELGTFIQNQYQLMLQIYDANNLSISKLLNQFPVLIICNKLKIKLEIGRVLFNPDPLLSVINQ